MSTTRILLCIVVVAVVARVGSAVYQGTGIEALPGVTDEISYHELAVRVVNGHGFSFGSPWWPATRANEPTAHWSYLYVLFLAGIYSVFGPAIIVARLLQAVLVGVLHPLLVWRIGRRVFSPAVGLVSAALTSVYGYFVFYGGSLVTESLFFLAVLWTLDLSTALADSRTGDRGLGRGRWLLLGVALASGALLRQAFVLMIPFILMWIAWQVTRRSQEKAFMTYRATAGRLALTVSVLLICIVPWTARNYRAFGEFALLNTNAGFVMFWGNHPVHGTEFIPIMSYSPVNYGTLLPRELRGLNEAQLDRALLARGIGFVRDDPKRYLLLSVSRVKEYFKFWPTTDTSLASNLVRVLSFGLAVPFLAFGVFLALFRKADDGRYGSSGATLLLLVAGLYSLMHVMTWTLVRYRLPVDAITMPFVGLSLVFLSSWVSSLVHVSNVPLRDSVS